VVEDKLNSEKRPEGETQLADLFLCDAHRAN